MRYPRRKGYNSLDELYVEQDGISWYWRLAALAASWMILGGYLILPSTFDSDPELRFSKGVLAVLIAILLTCGYSLTVLLWFLVPSWLFQSESIFYPALCSSALGLLGTLYAFASSPRYTFSSAAGITVALSSSSTAIYAILLVWVQRKIARVRSSASLYRVGHVEIPRGISRDGRESQASTTGLTQSLWHEPTSSTQVTWEEPPAPITQRSVQDSAYYKNWLQNMHPTAVRNPSIHTRASFQSLQRSPSPERQPQGYYDPTSTTTTVGGSIYNGVSTASVPPSPFPLTEEDLVNQQMARLLLKTGESTPGNESQSTFRIDWRTDDDDEEDPAQRGIQMRTRTGSGSRLIPPTKIAASAVTQGIRGAGSSKSMRAPSGGEASRVVKSSPFRGGDSARDGDVERGRVEAPRGAGLGIERARSREERRKEIEMGNLVASPVPTGKAASNRAMRYG
ncbi:hypothetical protein NA57DRAFT_51172 [Rhizodiscina lignyota]|uniref:Uncharacterized protein n=1 Tax=Rhizodiscina lignyota TaxID=1504668 RepID=A0A9P4ING2_9PEZI|nr:hypothetical protein NA57DRAFT_51172 [Rhizodiscina lignyota]